MAYLVKAPRVGRSQGAVIFWGLVSAFFASAFCYYYLENRTNEEKNRTLLDQVMILQGERDTLSSERDKMEAAAGDTEKQFHDREEFLQEKEGKLAEEESQIESTGSQTQGQSQLSQQQAATVKRFDDAVRQIVAQAPNTDVVVRGGRPVLRLPSSVFFASGDAQLSADGKADLDRVARSLGEEAGRFELRVDAFTDSDGEPIGMLPAPPAPPNMIDAWLLTAERAAAIAHYLRDQGTIPFQNVVAVGRADAPAIARAKDGSSRNRRIEITLAPVAAAFHAPEPKSTHAKSAAASPATAPASGHDSPDHTAAP